MQANRESCRPCQMWGTRMQGGHKQHPDAQQAHITQCPSNVLEDTLLPCHLHRWGIAGIHNSHNLLCPTGVI